ncbi:MULTISPECIES: FecR domain-containing protein [unclassified Phenylobacterium]|uniref:FecR family protein n=1 Tax=unclassified Phenylobacterium TaxID=2640670 RepID=UPI00083A2A38|nr:MULTISPECIES: FecR domain-containing protein [unclassified Phenylobacterium]
MRADGDRNIEARAIEWHVRLRDGDDATWEAFAEWLTADERHAQAYDAIEQTDLALEPLLPHVTIAEAANDAGASQAPRRPTRRWWLAGGAVAAAAAAAVVVAPQLAPSRYEVVTPPGERQVVQLDPGTRVTLNGGTRMTFDRRNPRFAALSGGEALFHVRHDAAKPFRLTVGGRIVEDAGTIFNVVHADGEVRVAVAEGKVIYDAGRKVAPLDAGQQLAERDGQRLVTDVAPQVVGTWAEGSLVYAAAPLTQVAADLSRALGVRIAVAPAIAGRPFSGAITLNGNDPSQLKRLEPALNVRLAKTAEGRWRMEPVERAGP